MTSISILNTSTVHMSSTVHWGHGTQKSMFKSHIFDWCQDQPEATYNLVNSPHLRAAFLLDRAVARLAIDIG